MNYPVSLRIALRYLLSRKSHGAVNVISAVSMAGVAVAAAAMIIVMSVFNGFSQLVDSKTSNFNPPLLLVNTDGSLFSDADSLANALETSPLVATAAPLMEEQAFAVSEYGQMPVYLRGMTPDALKASGLERILIDGEVQQGKAIISVGVAVSLNLRPTAVVEGFSNEPVTDIIAVFEPKRSGRVNPANPTAAFTGDSLTVAGVYQVEQEEQDRDMLIVPLDFARMLLDYTTEATAIAIYPAGDEDGIQALQRNLEIPAGTSLLDRRQQQADAFKMISIEKWITFLMLLFILAIASFNIISTLSLMVVEKEKNMGVMAAMGATPSLIQRIFANQGWLITLVGGCIGIAAGSLLTLGQMKFGWVKLQSSNPAMMAVDHYPVVLEPADIVTSLAAIILTGALISLVGFFISRPRR